MKVYILINIDRYEDDRETVRGVFSSREDAILHAAGIDHIEAPPDWLDKQFELEGGRYYAIGRMSWADRWWSDGEWIVEEWDVSRAAAVASSSPGPEEQ